MIAAFLRARQHEDGRLEFAAEDGGGWGRAGGGGVVWYPAVDPFGMRRFLVVPGFQEDEGGGGGAVALDEWEADAWTPDQTIAVGRVVDGTHVPEMFEFQKAWRFLAAPQLQDTIGHDEAVRIARLVENRANACVRVSRDWFVVSGGEAGNKLAFASRGGGSFDVSPRADFSRGGKEKFIHIAGGGLCEAGVVNDLPRDAYLAFLREEIYEEAEAEVVPQVVTRVETEAGDVDSGTVVRGFDAGIDIEAGIAADQERLRVLPFIAWKAVTPSGRNPQGVEEEEVKAALPITLKARENPQGGEGDETVAGKKKKSGRQFFTVGTGRSAR